MSTGHIAALLQALKEQYETGRDPGFHYIIPVRQGKLPGDVLFESEILTELIEKVCKVKDGKIVLKDGAQEVRVLREVVDR